MVISCSFVSFNLGFASCLLMITGSFRLTVKSSSNTGDHDTLHRSHYPVEWGQITKGFYFDATKTHKSPQEKISCSVWSDCTENSTIWSVLFFLLIKTRPCLLAGFTWSVCILSSLLFYFFRGFFTPAFADGFSLEFEWQLFSSSLQDFS